MGFTDHAGTYFGRSLIVDIRNERNDTAAKNCAARLKKYRSGGNAFHDTPDRSILKVDGSIGYTQFIWPESHGAFDLLWVHRDDPLSVSLLSALDIRRESIPLSKGYHDFVYEVYADNFEVYTFAVRVFLTGDLHLPAPEIILA